MDAFSGKCDTLPPDLTRKEINRMRMLLSAAALCALFCFCACSTVPERESSMSGEFLNAIRNLQGRKELAGMPLFHWTSSTDCKILFISDHRVSFQIEKSVYTGGAHGMTCTRVGTFQDGVLLKLADLPEQEKLELLWKQAVARHFKARILRSIPGSVRSSSRT